MKREEWVAPIPGRPWRTGLLLWLLACCSSVSHDFWRNLLRDGELGEVVADHLGLDLDLVELLAGVDTNDGTDHLGDDDHVTEVSLDEVGLLVGLGLLLGLAELLDQTHGLALEATVETSAGTSVDDIAELLAGEVEEPKKGKSVGRPWCARAIATSQIVVCPGVVRTRQGRCHGKRTCGKISWP
jgi:hypothetical protein